MKNRTVLFRSLAGSVAIWLLVVSSLRTTHVLFSHEHEGERLVCHDAAGDGRVHIHDERFHADACELCAFIIAPAEIPALPAIVATFTEETFWRRAHEPCALFLSSYRDFNYRRGPPQA